MTASNLVPVKLSQREKYILASLAKGLTAKEIAQSLYTSTKNVQRITLELRARFDCMNTTQLCVHLKEHYADCGNNTIAEGIGVR